MPKFETVPRYLRLALVGLFAGVLSVTSAQDAKPPVPPAAGPVKAAEEAVVPKLPANPVPSMRPTKPVVVEPTAPGAPGAPSLPTAPGPVNEPLFIPDIPAPGTTTPLPPMGPELPSSGPKKPPLERMYTVGKFVVKYGTDVQQRNPKLPKEEELAGSEVMLMDEPGKGLFHIPTPPTAGASKTAGSLVAITSAEQNERGEKTNEDLALHPPLPAAPDPVAPKPTADAKPGKKEAAKLTKEEKNAPKGIPKAQPKGTQVKLKVSAFGEPRAISAMALLDVYDAVVKKLTDRGLIGVYILADVNPRNGADTREGVLDVKVQVFISEVAKIRTIARKIPYKFRQTEIVLPKINDDDAPDGQPVQDPKHLWIKAKSPVFVSNPKKPGGPLEKPRLQDYLSRLNRFPGRRVDAAINATGETGKVMLDYLIREQKNFIIYAQEANNGTKSTGEWRSRIGLELRQLANKDDILRMEYTTTDLSRFNSGTLSYQFALVKPDVLKMRVYGLYGEFSAEDVGFSGATFTGDSLTAGVAMTWTPRYWHGFPLDITAGGEFLRVSVNNSATGGKSSVNFLMPYLAIGTERSTDKFSLSMNFQVKGSFSDQNQDQLNGLGRFQTDGAFWYGNADIAASIYLEPLLLGKKWGDLGPDGTKWKRGILANELALLVHSQYALGNRRLVPQLELIAGGAGSVRGYPESFTSGDSGFVGSLEYRLHVPRLFKPANIAKSGKTAKVAEEKEKNAKVGKAEPAAGKIAKAAASKKPGDSTGGAAQGELTTTTKEAPAGSAPSFQLRPRMAGGGADWDLIVRAFLDYGQTYNNHRLTSVEADRTMMSIGAGLELQMFKLPGKHGLPLYMTVRADYGYVLQSQHDLLLKPVEAGDNRIHLSATVAW
ncbi:MAG: hypothetical protein ABIP85_19360 [Chthoniobacteraceae bacterium]